MIDAEHYIATICHRDIDHCKEDRIWCLAESNTIHKFAIHCRVCGRHVRWPKKREIDANLKQFGFVTDDELSEFRKSNEKVLYEKFSLIADNLSRAEYALYANTGKLPSRLSYLT